MAHADGDSGIGRLGSTGTWSEMGQLQPWYTTVISIKSQNLDEQNEISLSTFPPHWSHKMQALDRSVFGPLMHHYNAACDAWILCAILMTIYDISEVLRYAFPLAFTPSQCCWWLSCSWNLSTQQTCLSDNELISFFLSLTEDAANDRQQTVELTEWVSSFLTAHQHN